MSDDKKLVELFSKYAFKFDRYCKEVLKVTLTKQQLEFCKAVNNILRAKHKLRECTKMGYTLEEVAEQKLLTDTEISFAKKKGISIMSGKGNGKDMVVACFMHFMMTCYAPVRIPCTAHRFTALSDILWNEFKKWNNRIGKDGKYICKVHDKYEVQSDKIINKDFVDQGSNFAIARTAKKEADNDDGQALAGQHTDYLIPIIEEASIVRDSSFKALFDTLTEWCNFMIIIFNPNRTSGFAWETQYGRYRDYFVRLHWNSEECERYDPIQLEVMRTKHWPRYPEGEPDNDYRVDVQGWPPISEEGALISFASIHDAICRQLEIPDITPIIAGIDPAGRGKDKTSICFRQGRKILAIREASGVMPSEITRSCMQLFNEFDPDRIVVEIDGNGWDIYCRLRETHLSSKCYTFEAKASSRFPDRWENKRTDTWMEVCDIFGEGGIDIIDNDELRDELKAMEKIVNNNGKLGIIGKKALRKRLKRSPDSADSLMISFSCKDEHLPRRGSEWKRNKRYLDMMNDDAMEDAWRVA